MISGSTLFSSILISIFASIVSGICVSLGDEKAKYILILSIFLSFFQFIIVGESIINGKRVIKDDIFKLVEVDGTLFCYDTNTKEFENLNSRYGKNL